ncbi:sensor histidine kinase [Geofilum rubicundum]|uniref:histidine kinase n=1 Tax=Geofilum rubicundum JCM 15548 TaxID=1236989 RepID=A0A0E9LR49_9BACT|nr:PAS domain-containing protein [Geofilum rubicundum]GAO27773.1 two-component system sensor histidine kinase [Geofilum rubicundum JCM 15548]
MDTKRFNNPRHFEAMTKYFKEKYHTIDVEGIICSDNHAFEFVLKYGVEIWDDVPVTFCGVNNIREFDIDTVKYKGVAEDINIAATLELINTLHPQLEELIVISDSTLSGLLFMDQFREAINTKSYPFRHKTIHAISARQLGADLSQIAPQNKAILLLSLYIPRNGATRDMIQEADFIRDRLDVPIYGNWDFLFGNFITGGVIITGRDQGLKAAQIMKSRLTDASETVPFLTLTPESKIIDYQQFDYYQLDSTLLPPDAIVINQPLSYLDRYKEEIIVVGLILGFLILIILFLLNIINQKRQVEKQLKKSESRLELALDGAHVGLWDIDFFKNDIFLNKWVSHLLGYETPDQLHFNLKNWDSYFHPQDIEQLKESFMMHVSGINASFSGEVRIRTVDDTFKWFSMHGKITEVIDQKPARMVGILMDIHFQREFEEQLRMAKEKAEESDRLKSSFLANMSHEIRTPMNAILGFSDILINGTFLTHEESEKYLQLIRASGESLLTLINDIIDISKIESGQFSLNNETFDLHVLLDKLEQVAHTILSNKSKEVKFILEKENKSPSLLITADQYRVEQIINNLVSNAIKFTSSGSIEVSYGIKENKNIVFKVKDTGQGIELKNHHVIFERFRQIDPGPNNNMGGTGLGLAITKSLVHLMGGKISVESALGKGACFTFNVPCKIHST